MKKIKDNKAITLIALIITIIILLILAGVAIRFSIGENGIFDKSKKSAEKYNEESAREKLEIALSDCFTDKYTNEKYNENEYLDSILGEKGFAVNGDIVIVDEYQFQIDRSVPKILSSLGKGKLNDDIQIAVTQNTATDYTKSTLTVEITFEGTISKIQINGVDETIPEKDENNKYTITKQVTENGSYTILAKDNEDKYKFATIKVSDLTENMDIYTVKDLETFRDNVNSGRTYGGKTVTLKANLNLEQVCSEKLGNWIPIGRPNLAFSGNFEGNNYTISGVYINDEKTEINDYGLFGTVYKGTIKNLKVNGKIKVMAENKERYNIGILVGYCNGTIENVHILEGSSLEGNKQVGGIVGCLSAESNITNSSCGEDIKGETSNVTIIGDYRVGGIAGYTEGNISSCFNTATVTSTGGHVGGIAGTNYGVGIFLCYNKGNISGNGRGEAGYSDAGGICGNGGRVEYCYNTGTIYGKMGQVAGINGNAYNCGKNIVQNCYNIGEVTEGTSAHKGAIVGQCYGAGINNCFWTKPDKGTDWGTESNSNKMTDEQMKAYTNENFVIDETGKNNGYPILKWEVNK